MIKNRLNKYLLLMVTDFVVDTIPNVEQLFKYITTGVSKG